MSSDETVQPIEIHIEENIIEDTIHESKTEEETLYIKPEKTFEEMTVEELQNEILERMRRNGPVTERMRQDVIENVYHNSLVTWVKSFNN